jgi:hypothetical protein
MSVKFSTKEKEVSERAWLENLCGKTLTDQEAFEAEKDLLGAYSWLVEMDKKYNPQLYEDSRD